MSEAYGKAMVADVVLSISRKPMEKSTGAGRLFVAKNRAGRDGLLFPINIVPISVSFLRRSLKTVLALRFPRSDN